MKRLSVFLGIFFLLTACGGGGGGGGVSCDQVFWNGFYGTCLPKGWNVLDQETLRQRGVPEEVTVAFQTEEARTGHFPAVTVTQERLVEIMEPSAYSDATVRSVSVFPGYELIDRRSVTIDDATVALHVFTAQPVAAQPKKRFYQMSTVAGGVGYTVTGTSTVSVDDRTEEEIVLILTRSTFMEPVEE